MPRSLLALLAGLLLVIAASSPAFAYPAVVTTDLNLRAAPTVSARVVGVMPGGSRVDVIGCAGSWCELVWRGRRGFASARYLSRAGAAPAPVQPRPPEIVIPLPFPDLRPRPERPVRECNERRASRVIGDRATDRVIQRAVRLAGASSVRVLERRDPRTFDFRPDRLNIIVNRRDIIIDLACG